VDQPHPQPKNQERAIELDFIRGIAILLVLNLHFNSDWPVNQLGLSFYGWMGVNLFFVLSGFLVGGLLMKERKRTGRVDGWRFLRRRALKIWPPYYFYLLFIVVTHEHPLNSFLIQNLLHIQNYMGTSLTQTWTLAVEEHFYLLLTLFMMLALYLNLSMRQIVIILTLLTEGLLLLKGILMHYGFQTFGYTHTNMDSLLVGVILAAIFNYWPATFASIQKRRGLILASILGGLIYVVFVNRRISSNYILDGIAADLICGGFLLFCFRPQPNPNRSWLYRLIAAIGVYSYGIYLWHLAARTGLERMTHHLHLPGSLALWLVVIFRIPLAIIAGIVMTKLIEFPFLKLRDRLIPAPANSHLLPDGQR
jgi:peptidoglycan/LPS O-acetylase OafA/YrhL